MRRAIWTLLFAALALSAQGCGKGDGSSKGAESAHEAFGRMSVEELSTKMAEAKAGKAALFIYDNNRQERFKEGHIPGAKWVDHDNIQAGDLPQDKNATLVFYCANEH